MFTKHHGPFAVGTVDDAAVVTAATGETGITVVVVILSR